MVRTVGSNGLQRRWKLIYSAARDVTTQQAEKDDPRVRVEIPHALREHEGRLRQNDMTGHIWSSIRLPGNGRATATRIARE